MPTIKKEVFLGKNEEYNNLLKLIADYAQPEKWSYGPYKASDPYKMLRNYFEHTYDRLSEEDKFVISNDGNYKCMNTGLLTPYHQEIYAVFTKNTRSSGLPWKFTRVYKDTDRFIATNFPKKPELANYFDNVSDLIYDKNLEIILNINHIVDDNSSRFADAGYLVPEVTIALLSSAQIVLKKKLLRNFKLALPFYYHNTSTDERKIQLLVPVFFPNSPVRLALVLDKQIGGDGKEYYEAITVLPVEWAYMNSRLIVKPDDEWAKLIDDLDGISDISDSIEESIISNE